MEKFIPYEKLSKKEKRKIDQARRQTWGELNPVTRKPENSKAYNRNKARNWMREEHETNSGTFLFTCYRTTKVQLPAGGFFSMTGFVHMLHPISFPVSISSRIFIVIPPMFQIRLQWFSCDPQWAVSGDNVFRRRGNRYSRRLCLRTMPSDDK